MKQVQVITRYALKTDGVLNGTVVYLVRNGSNKEYLVTLLPDGSISCIHADTDRPCEAGQFGHVCYHKTTCMAIESARGTHLEGNGSLAGFKFVAPEEKKVTNEELYEMTDEARLIALQTMSLAELKELAKDRHVKTQRSKAAYVEALDNDYREQKTADALIEEKIAALQASKNVPTIAPESPVIVPEMPTEDEEFSEEVAPKWTEEAIAEEPALIIARVHTCVRELANVCDGARDEDGQGFNGVDADFGHELAARRELTPKQVLAAARMLQKYNRTQLGGRVPSVKAVERALAPKAPSTPPQAPKFHGNLNGNRSFANVLLNR